MRKKRRKLGNWEQIRTRGFGKEENTTRGLLHSELWLRSGSPQYIAIKLKKSLDGNH